MRALSLCFSVLILTIGGGAPAFGVLPTYKAVPRTAPGDGQQIVHDLAWRCSSGSCVASRTGSSTDSTICSALARTVGPLTAFAVGNDEFSPAALEKCNRRAR